MAFLPVPPLLLKNNVQPSFALSNLVKFANHARRPLHGKGQPTTLLNSHHVAMSASSDSSRLSGQSRAVFVQRTKTAADLEAIYKVWNTVADAENLPPLSPDDHDGAEDTIHFIARSHTTGVAVGAARLLHVEQNACLHRVAVIPQWRGHAVGRALVEKLLTFATAVPGSIYVNASRGAEMGFFSILGFESFGNSRIENSTIVRTMMYRFPTCAPSSGCVGLHHTSIRVSDIERSLAFYGSIGFFITEKFVTSGGHRACFVEGLGTRLELVEVIDGKGGLSGVQGIPPAGFDRLVFDVTKACTNLDTYLQHLQRKNGGILEVVGEPSKQVLGSSVMSVASISDPDGLPIEFFRREALVPGELRTRVKW